MIKSGKFAQKKILLIDKDLKQRNDRTWSFWETKPGLFEEIVYRRWSKTCFYGKDFSRLLELDPYEYKMIRGIDFYQYCLELIRQQPNFEILNSGINSFSSQETTATVHTDQGTFAADYIFNSILFDKPVLKKKEYYLLQHFKGWVIETDVPSFNPSEATLMDFRVDQEHGTTFVYVKPFSATKALVEYTLFTENLLSDEAYDQGLKNYIQEFLQIDSYTITETETGVIPMTNHRFPIADGRIINIGTAGGQTRASSGYTFQFIQKHSAKIVADLIKDGKPSLQRMNSKKAHFYDSVLLFILKNRKVPGDRIFTLLFKKNKPQHVLRFLDSESSLSEDLKIISSLPTWPFLKAALLV